MVDVSDKDLYNNALRILENRLVNYLESKTLPQNFNPNDLEIRRRGKEHVNNVETFSVIVDCHSENLEHTEIKKVSRTLESAIQSVLSNDFANNQYSISADARATLRYKVFVGENITHAISPA